MSQEVDLAVLNSSGVLKRVSATNPLPVSAGGGSAGTPAGGVQSIQGVPLGAPVPVEQPMFNVLGTTLTRPANVTAYTALDSISDNATAGSVTANHVNIADINDAPFALSEIELDSSDTGLSGVQVRMYLFVSDPTASTGVGAGDNVAYSNKRAGFRRSFIGTFLPFSDGAKAILVPEIGSLPQGGVALLSPETGGKGVWWQLQTLSAFTPSANSTTFTPRFKGWQARLAA